MRLSVLTVARDAGPGVGGTEVLVQELLRRLDRERFRPLLLTTRAPVPERGAIVREMDADLHAAGIPTFSLGRERTAQLAPFARLPLLMRRERIDIVHAHMPRASVPASLAARLAGIPAIISHEHGSVLSGEGKRMRRLLDRHIVARCSDVMVAVSDWDRQNLIAAEGIPSERIRVLRNGIAPLPRRRDPAIVRAELTPAGEPLILAVGRLVPVKGYDVLVRAAARMREDGRRFHLAVAGDGPERAALEALVGELGLAAQVTLLGMRRDVGDLLAAADVVAMSSHSEGAPLAILEYMAAGAPIVATNVGGIPELVEDGVHGLLVAPGDPSALASALARLLEDPMLARRLGTAGRARHRERFDLDVMVGELQALYEELYAASGRAQVRERRGHRSRRMLVPGLREPRALGRGHESLGDSPAERA